ncbi:Gfo/Idh/MocA family protein [Haloarchaeobius sp. HME9146]|uniref:Gfo/Idh/MocA family protein n=1 Tax=Haloarchaeobius sp. HME9146 TaxID=2978732 RepID=UPI0021C05F6F|nr:Gfo/Idh/MocA family oxidoreductase [Haloarchaeobius sp. HME9146]MCT9096552.1 Gfo/Idh/MocA family oxidoreductase [Haloarchaeobius sp. HME9146]
MRFGILSTANIGLKAVVPAIQASEHEVAAIASRDADRAAAVAQSHDIPASYGSYQDLLDEAAIDAVYIPVPNSLHAEWVRKAADAGLDVLCEKPLAVDATEARELGEYCEDAGVTLMSAFMYRYHPRTERAAEIVAEELDQVRGAFATFQFPLRDRPDDIRLNPELAGGSLMDVGCYSVSVLRTLLGEPDSVSARRLDTRDCGVDTHLTGRFDYPDATAQLSCSFDTQLVQRYRIEAENGWLEVEDAFNPSNPDEVTLEYAVDGREVTESFDATDQYRLQVEHFADCVESGEQPRTDAAEATANMQVIDALYESADTGETVRLD